MKETHMKKIAKWIGAVIKIVGKVELPENKEERNDYFKARRDELAKNKELQKIWTEVRSFASKFPVPGI